MASAFFFEESHLKKLARFAEVNNRRARGVCDVVGGREAKAQPNRCKLTLRALSSGE